MTLAKATISAGALDSVSFQFNPESVEFTTGANWKTNRVQVGEDGPVQQYEGTDPIKLKLDMLLDEVEHGSAKSISDTVNRIASWTNPVKSKMNADGKPTSPELKFEWGEFKLGRGGPFKCFLHSARVQYTMFRTDGVPIRAKLQLELVSATTKVFAQNPTSGGRLPYKQHTLTRGDRLATIAAAEYGNPRFWRQLAEFNSIDDPTHLPIGRQLVLPARRELEDH